MEENESHIHIHIVVFKPLLDGRPTLTSKIKTLIGSSLEVYFGLIKLTLIEYSLMYLLIIIIMTRLENNEKVRL